MKKKLHSLVQPFVSLPRSVYFLATARVIYALGLFVWPMLTLILTRKIGLSTDKAGIFFSAFGFMTIPAVLVGGKLADLFGRKRLIVISESMVIVLYVFCGLLPPSMLTVWLLLCMGLFLSLPGPAYDALVSDLTTPERRQGAFSLLYICWNIGFAFGPAIGGFLFDRNYPLIFFGNAAATAVSLCIIIFFTRETITDARSARYDGERVLENPTDEPVVKVLLRFPVLIWMCLILFGYEFVYSQWTFMLPMQMSKATNFGILATVNGLTVIAMTPLLTRFMSKFPNLVNLVVAGLCFAAGFGLFGFFNSMPLFITGTCIFTLGEILLTINVLPYVMNRTPASHRGRMSAIFPIIYGIGFALGPAVMGKVLTKIPIMTGWIVLAVLLLFFSFFMLVLYYSERRKANAGTDQT